MYDLVICGGTIIDPRHRLKTVGNIGIKDGIMVSVTRESIEGAEMIDATGKIVCPGFIDIHSHLHKELGPVWMSARQGITTCLSGNCGLLTELPVRSYLDSIEKMGYPINYATLVGHSWKLREEVGLTDPYSAADEAQTRRMTELAAEALEDGAFGVSLGLEYAPGANKAEYMPLVSLAAKYDKLVPIHARNGAIDFASGLWEVISMMEETGARVHISHLTYMYALHPEVMDMTFVMIRHAIERGLPLLCDSGVYDAFATYVQSAVFDEGWCEAFNAKLSDLMISSGKYSGQRATEEIYQYVRTQEKETVGTAFVGIAPDMIKAILEPYTMVSTDAGLVDAPGEGHPQDSGTFPKLFGEIVREQGALSMMDAVIKSTWMPACQMKIEDRKGWIGEGADADIVVFDPKTIRSNSDYVGLGQPDAPPTGVEYVIVNGVAIVWESEAREDRLPGRVLRQFNTHWHM